jgi:hypothetical protein
LTLANKSFNNNNPLQSQYSSPQNSNNDEIDSDNDDDNGDIIKEKDLTVYDRLTFELNFYSP